jgi:hypothetical protein
VQTNEPVIIENSIIRSKSTCIEVLGGKANITVTNTIGVGLNPGVRGQIVGRFLDVDNFVRAVVENNYMENTAGIYFSRYRGTNRAGQTISVYGNIARNIDGRFSNGDGGWLTSAADQDEYRHFVQLNEVYGIKNVDISWNQVVNLPGESRVQEGISIHESSGTRRSPISIHDNYIYGAFPFGKGDVPDYTGVGILLSDNGSSYVEAFGNQVVSTGPVGIAISSGHDNRFFDNRILSSGRLADGKDIHFSNVGAAIWNFNDEPDFSRNSGYDNELGWVDGRGRRNDAWVPDAQQWYGNDRINGKITLKTEKGEWKLWQQRVAEAGVSLGVTNAAKGRKARRAIVAKVQSASATPFASTPLTAFANLSASAPLDILDSRGNEVLSSRKTSSR